MSIQVKDIRKQFGAFVALDDVTLDFPAGELVALLGPSGCGKTTLLRIVAGLEQADSGHVLLDGEDASDTHVRERRVGFVFQHYALFRHMSVFDNVAFGMRMKPRGQRPPAQAIRDKVHDLLRLVQLDWLAGRFPAQLSGGQRQRIALARALAVEPRVLLLDEPFGALDAKVRKELRRWLRKLHDDLHITSIFVTHDQEEALEVADRVVVMDRGRVEQVGMPQEVVEQPATAFVDDFLDLDDDGPAWLVRAKIRHRGYILHPAEGMEGGMNFQQLRIIRETVRRNFNLTEVANALFTSQSGVSKHIKDLEDELGIEIFVRKGKRLLGLTDPGKDLVVLVERMLLDAKNIKSLADQYSNRDQGQLTVATTHTQARYALPKVVTEFKKAFPKVHLKLHQGGPDEIVKMLTEGQADIGIATEAVADVADLASFPYYSWRHAVIVPAGHPLETVQPLTLEAIAEHPVITYHEGFTGRARIDRSFAAAGLVPDVVMSALDADVIKTYVELGLGVGILASMAFNPARDEGLRLLDTRHLFEENVTRIAIHRGHYLRGYAYKFIELCAPELNEGVVRTALKPAKDDLALE